MKKLVTICLVTMIILAIGQANGNVNNYNPAIPAPAPVLDAGWASDQVNLASTDSLDSPYAYSLTNSAYFRITDDYIVGDTYSVYDFGSLILTTIAAHTGAPTGFSGGGEIAWQSGLYSGGEVLLTPGNHFLTVQGDGAGGLPAGFWTQLSSVPEPTTICLLGFGVLSLIRRRKLA
jgi:hypothetical protein